MTLNHKLPKKERLTGITNFSRLAEGGAHLFAHPLKLFWRKVEADEKVLVRVATVAPKRLYKSAPDRNFIKRKLREAYRTNKEPFYKSNNNLHLLWVYISKNPDDVSLIPAAMNKLAEKLNKELNNINL